MRTTLLKHTLPDGSWHIDWLIETELGEPPRVPTFRLAERPDQDHLQVFDAEQLPDHRRLYLDYSGPVSGNRGDVQHISTGAVLAVKGWPEELGIVVQLESRLWRWLGRSTRGTTWRFERLADDE